MLHKPRHLLRNFLTHYQLLYNSQHQIGYWHKSPHPNLQSYATIYNLIPKYYCNKHPLHYNNSYCILNHNLKQYRQRNKRHHPNH